MGQNVPVLPPLEIVARERPLALVSPATSVRHPVGGTSSRYAAARPAPYVAVVADLASEALRHDAEGGEDAPAGRVELFLASGGTRLAGWYEPARGAVGLTVTDPAGRRTSHHSRRFGTATDRPDAFALTLTGMHLTVLCLDGEEWTARGRVDLTGRVDPHDEGWLTGLTLGHQAAEGQVAGLTSGGFGHLGLRDLRLVTEADGTPVRDGGDWLLTATSAGPGFFDTAHTSVWRLAADADRLTHCADLYFRRPDVPGVFGDHAVHLLRDGGRWLVATSTWGDFDRRRVPGVRCTLAESGADLLRGEHVVDTRELPLPTDGLTSVGVWDPHLLRDGDTWLVGYASASRFFRFHPCVASGPTLDDLTLRAAAPERRATEGVTLLRLDGPTSPVRVLASDGRDSRRELRARYPVLDLDLRELGTLDAPYPTNLPWPTLLPDEHGWRMVTFNGRAAGGELLGYGTHGDVVHLRERDRPALG